MSKIKKIVAHHVCYCTFCKAEGHRVQATWRMTMDSTHTTACDEHKSMLQPKVEKREDYSEADYQTWLSV